MEPQTDNKPGIIRPWILITVIVLVIAAIGFFTWHYLQKNNALPLPTTTPTTTPVVTPKTTPSPVVSESANTATPSTTKTVTNGNTKKYNTTIQSGSMGTNCDGVKLAFNYPDNYSITTETIPSENPDKVLIKLINPSDTDYIKFPSYSEKTQQETILINVGQDSTGGCGGVDQWTAFQSDYASLLKHYQEIYNNIVGEPKKIDVNGHEAIQFMHQNKYIYKGTPSSPINPFVMVNIITQKTVIANDNEPAINIEMSKKAIKDDNGDNIYPEASLSANALEAYNTVVNSITVK